MHGKRPLAVLCCALLILVSCAAEPKQIPDAQRRHLQTAGAPGQPQVLVVVAHPDDEILFAGLLYKLRTHLNGAADVLAITNGEGGFKYSTLAEELYGVELTDEPIGRRFLPALRAEEMAAGCRILGVRDLYLLSQQDHRYTQDVGEVLGPEAKVWDRRLVRRALHKLLDQCAYDFVLLLAPTAQTHAHHQAATLLTLEVLAERPLESRPIALCAMGASAETPNPQAPAPRPEFPLADLRAGAPTWTFDRTQPFGHRSRLDYRIIANWAIAEHKSQGTMQLLMNHTLQEHYFLFDLSPQSAAEELDTLFTRLAEPQFPLREYAASAGTNATQ